MHPIRRTRLLRKNGRRLKVCCLSSSRTSSEPSKRSRLRKRAAQEVFILAERNYEATLSTTKNSEGQWSALPSRAAKLGSEGGTGRCQPTGGRRMPAGRLAASAHRLAPRPTHRAAKYGRKFDNDAICVERACWRRMPAGRLHLSGARRVCTEGLKQCVASKSRAVKQRPTSSHWHTH